MNNNAIGNLKLSSEQISAELRDIYRSDSTGAESMIETYLGLIFKGLSEEEKILAVESLKGSFPFTRPQPAEVTDETPGAEALTETPVETSPDVTEEMEAPPEEMPEPLQPEDSDIPEENELKAFFSLLLGYDIQESDCSQEELMNRLSDSLNTIFISLNELVSAINTSILGDYSDDKTIRQIISYHLGDERHLDLLADYIGRVKQTFLLTQQSFKSAARTTVENILKEFNPEQIKAEADQGFGFGAMKKAQYFKAFEKKYELCKKWFESDRFMESFLREFEKNCQNQSETMKK